MSNTPFNAPMYLVAFDRRALKEAFALQAKPKAFASADDEWSEFWANNTRLPMWADCKPWPVTAKTKAFALNGI